MAIPVGWMDCVLDCARTSSGETNRNVYDRSLGRVVSIGSIDPFTLYQNVQFCELPTPVKRFGAICAQSYVTEKERVLDWVGWHLAQGFDHAMLSINQEHGALQMMGDSKRQSQMGH
jgi:hypothetical protein